MKTLVSLGVLLVLGGILGAGPATRPSLKLTDKQILAGYEVALTASKTRDGIPRRNGIIRPAEGGRISVAIIGEEGEPSMIMLPAMTLAKNALEGNAGTLVVAQTVFCNVVVTEDEKRQFQRMVRDLVDAINTRRDSVTRDFGDVRVVLNVLSQTEALLDVNLTFTRKPG